MTELKSHSSHFFEVIVAMQQMQEDGNMKMVKQTIVIEALTFGEAEQLALEEMEPYSNGELKIVNINPASYGEVFTSDDDQDDRFYKCKLSFITADEKTAKEKKSKEKKSKVTYLVQAASTNKAQSYIDKSIMAGSMMDYETCSISETKIESASFLNGEE